jgi:hypothetical protein
MDLDPEVWGSVFPELHGRRESRHPRPILGFRMNRVDYLGRLFGRRNPVLTSLGRAYCWQPGRNTASCLKNPGQGHDAPAAGCSCGFYAFRSLADVDGALAPFSVLVGVAASGIVRIHQHGWRAQFARIVAISSETHLPRAFGSFRTLPPQIGTRFQIPPFLPRELASVLERKYRVPVVALNDLIDVMRAEGDFLEEEL